MINKLKNMELEYVRCFSDEKEFENHIEFRDRIFRDTYTSNVSIIKSTVDDCELIDIINNEFKIFKRRGRDFLNLEINKYVSSEVIKKFLKRPKRIDRFNYLLIESANCKPLEKKQSIYLKRVEEREEFKSLIDINVKDNEKILGKSYSLYRIKRKVKAYRDDKNNLESYLCYYKETPIGSCEVLRIDNICKIEDVGILEKYRGNGFGTYMIKSLLEDNCKKGIEYTYLITERNGVAEKLYKKLGFIKFAEKTQLIW